MFSFLYGRGLYYKYSVQNFQKTSEETRSSDIKQHQNCVTLWNKMLTHEEVIMIVKLWGVDRHHLRSDYHSEFNSWSFCLKSFFFYETYPYSSVYKTMH